jgi:cytochrome P450
VSDHPPQDWNPRASEVLTDQRDTYDAMRERCPVAYSDAMKWSVFRHADVMAVLDDPDTFINSSRHLAIPNSMNGEEHAIHRAELAPYFTDEEMQAVEPRCRAIATEVIGALDLSFPVDAVTEIVEPIALRTMCAFLGWPEEMWERVRDWIHGNRTATFHQDREASAHLADEYAAIVTAAIEEHRHQGGEDDVMSRLMRTSIAGHQWSDDDIVATLRNWVAGHGSVVATAGIIFAHLAKDQDLQRRLRAQPDLIPAMIDEVPRSDGPLVANSRTTTSEVTIGGRTIPAGERLSLMWIAADRDPAVFAAPDEIQLDRSQAANLTYGAGIHYCLGAPLARLEARVMVEVLLAQTANLTLATDAPLVRETLPGNGFISVPVRMIAPLGKA